MKWELKMRILKQQGVKQVCKILSECTESILRGSGWWIFGKTNLYCTISLSQDHDKCRQSFIFPFSGCITCVLIVHFPGSPRPKRLFRIKSAHVSVSVTDADRSRWDETELNLRLRPTIIQADYWSLSPNGEAAKRWHWSFFYFIFFFSSKNETRIHFVIVWHKHEE